MSEVAAARPDTGHRHSTPGRVPTPPAGWRARPVRLPASAAPDGGKVMARQSPAQQKALLTSGDADRKGLGSGA